MRTFKNKKFSILILLVLIFLTITLVFPKNNKIQRKHVRLNYDLTYEEAFPDKEFRRMILTMRHLYNPNDYNKNSYYLYNNFSGAMKATGACVECGIGKSTPLLDDSKLSMYEKDKLDKNFLDSVQILHGNREVAELQNISNLKGIEYFPNLQVLAISGTKIKEADFSNNLELETLFLPEKFYSSSGSSNITGSSLLEKVNIKNIDLGFEIKLFNP